jgi:hypothetical protein
LFEQERAVDQLDEDATVLTDSTALAISVSLRGSLGVGKRAKNQLHARAMSLVLALVARFERQPRQFVARCD